VRCGDLRTRPGPRPGNCPQDPRVPKNSHTAACPRLLAHRAPRQIAFSHQSAGIVPPEGPGPREFASVQGILGVGMVGWERFFQSGNRSKSSRKGLPSLVRADRFFQSANRSKSASEGEFLGGLTGRVEPGELRPAQIAV
jgi:hypothetical protein